MSNILKGMLLVIILFLAMIALAGARNDNEVSWMLFTYQLEKINDQEYGRVLENKDIQVIDFTLRTDKEVSQKTKERILRWTAKGKRIILHIWWGNWEKFNQPDIVMNPALRAEFFSEHIAPIIDAIGQKNIYAIHLLEESGLCYGFDTDISGDPNNNDDGFELDGPFNNPMIVRPFNPKKRGPAGPNISSLRRYNHILKRETGLDMQRHPLWGDGEWELFKKWTLERFEGGFHSLFAQYVHQKWPDVKVYAWNRGYALSSELEDLDGIIIDSYSSISGIHSTVGRIRTIMPLKDLVTLIWGSRKGSKEYRLARLGVVYALGGNVLSMFGDKEYESAEWINIVGTTMEPFINRPCFKRKRPEVLIFADGILGHSWYNSVYWAKSFADNDTCNNGTIQGIDLSRYKFILAWGETDPRLEQWVKEGGVLVQMMPPPDDFVFKNKLLTPTFKRRISRDQPFIYKPAKWFIDNFNLSSSYNLRLSRWFDYKTTNLKGAHMDQFLSCVEYGKGMVVSILALPSLMNGKSTPESNTFRRLLRDICRGSLKSAGKETVAEEWFDDPRKGHDYFRIVSQDGKTKVYILKIDLQNSKKDLHNGQINKTLSDTSFVVRGRDRISGKMNATLNVENPLIIIDKEK